MPVWFWPHGIASRHSPDELGRAVAVRCDVTDGAQVDSLVQAALDEFGRIDVLFDSAGRGLQAETERIPLDDPRAVLELNLIAPLAMMPAVLPTMRRQDAGSIMNISSGTTLADVAGTGGYVASELALERLSAIARTELDGTGIVVSTMIPFATSTDFFTSIRAGRADAEATTGDAEFDTPEQVADATLRLIRSGEPRMDLVPAAYGATRCFAAALSRCSLSRRPSRRPCTRRWAAGRSSRRSD